MTESMQHFLELVSKDEAQVAKIGVMGVGTKDTNGKTSACVLLGCRASAMEFDPTDILPRIRPPAKFSGAAERKKSKAPCGMRSPISAAGDAHKAVFA